MKNKLKVFFLSLLTLLLCSQLYANPAWYDDFAFSTCKSDEGLEKSGKIVIFYNNTDFKSRINLEKEIVKAFQDKGLNAESFSKNFFGPEFEDEDFNIFDAVQKLNPRYFLIVEIEDLNCLIGNLIRNWETMTYVFDFKERDYIAQISATLNTSESDYDISYAESLKETSPLMGDAIANEYYSYIK